MKNYSKQKTIIALIANIIIVMLEIAGSVVYLSENGLIKAFRYYTQNSNYFALFASLAFCIGAIFALKNKTSIPKWIHVLRFVATSCLTVTLIVVLFILIPILPSGAFSYLMFQHSGLFHHTLCPVFSIVSLLFLENQVKLSKRAITFAIIPTTIYGVTCIILNILKVMTGPYPFFYVYMIPWYIAVVFNSGIFLGAVAIAWALYALYNRRYKKYEYKIQYLQQNA